MRYKFKVVCSGMQTYKIDRESQKGESDQSRFSLSRKRESRGKGTGRGDWDKMRKCEGEIICSAPLVFFADSGTTLHTETLYQFERERNAFLSQKHGCSILDKFSDEKNRGMLIIEDLSVKDTNWNTLFFSVYFRIFGFKKIMKMETRIKLIQGDITKLEVDAIVNAANSSLMGGGGVDGAIHRAGGPIILAECREIVARQRHCATGQAVITSGGNLPAKYVIHTVGPVWHGGNSNEAELLENAYLNSLKLATENRIETIAFPNISTGVYGFPKDKAAEIAVKTVTEFLSETDQIQHVYFVCFDHENYELYQRLL